MAQPTPTLTASRSIAPQAAQVVLALLAAAQIGLVVHALRGREAKKAQTTADSLAAIASSRRLAAAPKAPVSKPAPAAKKTPAPPSVPVAVASAPAKPATKVVVSSDLPPRDPAALLRMSGLAADPGLAPVPQLAPAPPASIAATVPTAPPASAAPPVSRRPALPPGKELADPKLIKMVEDARQVRRSGDIQAAIASFKAADALKANHPEILSELALSYEALGLADKSQSAWSRVRAMGPEGAGGYYNLAVSKLEGAPQAAATVEQNAVSLGQCSTSKAGNRVVLHVPMTAGEGQSINPDLMDIQIYFFEKADGQRIETAPNSRLGNSRWSAAAPQWAPGKPEVMEIEYVPPTPGSTPSSLEYHGYMVKLYYQDKFMGEQADPPALLKFRSQNEGSGGPENALLPPIK